MQADRRDRSDNAGENARSRHGTQALLMVVVAVILAGGALLMLPGEPGEPGETPEELPETPAAPAVVAEPPQPDPAENIRQAPDIPEPKPAPEPEPVADAEAEPPPEPQAPSTEEIDARLRSSLEDAGADDSGVLAAALSAPFLLDRSVSAIDQVARGYVPLRALNVPRPEGQYTVRREGQKRFVDEGAYRRYDRLVDGITAMNPEQLAAAFQRHRDLLASGYAALGYPADAMDNAVIAALDAILAAPVIRRPLELTSKGALYAYADPALESRSDMEKQLLRIGPDNLEVLQRWARDLRGALLQ